MTEGGCIATDLHQLQPFQQGKYNAATRSITMGTITMPPL
jgi:hypothetical protein